MSKTLPTVRLLQREIEDMEWIQGSDPSKTKTGKESNAWKMVEGFIKAQVKGQYKAQEGKSLKWDVNVDQNGDGTETYLDITGSLDTLLRWNSLLRIGLSPINAISNIGFGKLSNIWNQTINEDSVLNKLLRELNILQELTEFEYSEKLRTTKKLTGERLAELMYLPQKSGEKYIQSSMMLAIMIKNGYLTPNGELTNKYNTATENEKQDLVNEIQRTNQVLHGRYSPQEAAIAQQYVLYRLVSQFRKWLPSGIEARLDTKHYDQRLKRDVEGRWITLGKMVANLNDSISRLQKGELKDYEKYNMKKNILEIIITLASLFAIAMLKSNPDDDKKRKNAWYKSSMLLLNRVSGDTSFFFSPDQLINLGKNAIPVTKLLNDLKELTIYSQGYVGGEFTKAFTEDAKFKSGIYKGQYKLPKKLLDVTPGARLGTDLFQILNDNPLNELP